VFALCSAATAELVQPKRQAPAIQMETLIDSNNRTTLFEKNKLILLKSLLLDRVFCRDSNSKQNRHQNPALL